jgi:hypothetical protein
MEGAEALHWRRTARWGCKLGAGSLGEGDVLGVLVLTFICGLLERQMSEGP